MQVTSETLLNPLVDNRLIPIDISRSLYDMPIIAVEDGPSLALPRKPAHEGRDGYIKTMDDIRYEMIMSFFITLR